MRPVHSPFQGFFLLSLVAVILCLCSADDKTIFEVVGTGECADCKENNFMTSTKAFSGLRVTIGCKLKNGDMKRMGASELDEQGNFKVSLPQDLVENGEKLKQECYAQLHSAAAIPCRPAHNGLEAAKIIFKSQTNGKHIFVPTKNLQFSSALCTSKFFWPYFKYPPLPPLKHFGHPWLLPPLPPKPLPPPFPVYEPPAVVKPLPPPAPVYKPEPPVVKPLPPVPAPIYKPKPKPEPPVVKPLPPPAPVYKPKPPVPIYKPKPPVYKQPKKPCPPIKPKPPVYKPPVEKPPVYKPPVYKPPVEKPPVYEPPVRKKPLPPPIPLYPLPPITKKPCPPLPKLPPFPKIPPKYFHHPKSGYFPPLPPAIPHA